MEILQPDSLFRQLVDIRSRDVTAVIAGIFPPQIVCYDDDDVWLFLGSSEREAGSQEESGLCE